MACLLYTSDILLGGLASGLASTGLFEMVKGMKKEKVVLSPGSKVAVDDEMTIVCAKESQQVEPVSQAEEQTATIADGKAAAHGQQTDAAAENADAAQPPHPAVADTDESTAGAQAERKAELSR